MATIRPNEANAADKQTFSLPNIHGDVFAVTDANGALKSTHLTGPFGEQIAGQMAANNTVGRASYGYTGQHQKLSESGMTLAAVQMGERTYIPKLGRFLQVDPVEGGVDNNYVYPVDPVNDFDLDGQWGFKSMMKKVATVSSFVAMVPGPVGMAASAVSAASYAASGDKKNAVLMAAGIAASAVGAGAAVKGYQVAKAGFKTAKIASKAKNLSQQLA